MNAYYLIKIVLLRHTKHVQYKPHQHSDEVNAVVEERTFTQYVQEAPHIDFASHSDQITLIA